MIIATGSTVSDEDIILIKDAAMQASELLKCLANNHRLLILCLLSNKEMSVAEINEHIKLGQSPLSQHLAKLRSEKLVKTRKVAQQVFYSLDSPKAAEIIKTLCRLYATDTEQTY